MQKNNELQPYCPITQCLNDAEEKKQEDAVVWVFSCCLICFIANNPLINILSMLIHLLLCCYGNQKFWLSSYVLLRVFFSARLITSQFEYVKYCALLSFQIAYPKPFLFPLGLIPIPWSQSHSMVFGFVLT